MNVCILNPTRSCFKYELENIEDVIGANYKTVVLQDNMIALYAYNSDSRDILCCSINGIALFNTVVICGLNDGKIEDLEDKEILRMKYGNKIKWQ